MARSLRMDGRQFDHVSKKLSAWLTRRKLFTGLSAGAVGSILVRGSSSSKSQGDSYQETPADPPVEPPVEEESVSTDESPTDTPTPTPTDESPPAEEQGQEQGQGQGEGQEPPPGQTGSRAAPDESRR